MTDGKWKFSLEYISPLTLSIGKFSMMMLKSFVSCKEVMIFETTKLISWLNP